MNKKGQVFENLKYLGIGVLTLTIVLVVMFVIMGQTREQIGDIQNIDETNSTQCKTSAACNATGELIEAGADIPGWVPLIILAAIGLVLLGIVKMFR